MSRFSRSTLAGFGLVLAVLVVAAFMISRTPGSVLGGDLLTISLAQPGDDQVTYVLSEGSSASTIGDELQALGVIRSGSQFQLLVSLMGVHDRIQADTYRFQKGLPATVVIDRMVNRVTIPTDRVTFPEGIRIEEMAALAEEAGFGTRDEFLAAVAAATVPPELEAIIPAGTTYDRFQGFLFPDTYILPVGAQPEDLVSLMLDTMVIRFSAELQQAAAAQGLTPYDAIRLAAIVEREAVLAEERPVIASVFLNRLRDGIKLDADPTVQYAVAADPASVAEFGYWKRGLTVADLDTVSPYNTYLNAGLPPSPITNPGLAAIEAVAHPDVTPFYYFVADGIKGDGSHVFAETYEEHLVNVDRYLE
ncbi:MAG: endolytic transglycosylase MltG [Tepidiformaceae bacterium]